MNHSLILASACVVISFLGCLSSEETGADGRIQTPVQILGSIDTTHVVPRRIKRDTAPSRKIDSSKTAMHKQHVAPRFKAKQDTVQASLIVKPKSPSHQAAKIERPDNPVYTVQIGAYGKASNAVQCQKVTRKRFTTVPVYNYYVKSAKIYRVSIGKFEDRQAAGVMMKKIQKKYPRDYQKCWINYFVR